jgi:hypothetical protein
MKDCFARASTVRRSLFQLPLLSPLRGVRRHARHHDSLARFGYSDIVLEDALRLAEIEEGAGPLIPVPWHFTDLVAITTRTSHGKHAGRPTLPYTLPSAGASILSNLVVTAFASSS